jgi:hypothetical protein
MTMVVVAGLAGRGLAAVSAAASAGGAAGAPPTRHAELVSDVTCRNLPRGIDLTGHIRVGADLPVSVAPGEQFTVHPDITFTIDPPAIATPRQVTLFAPVTSGGGVATIAVPTSARSVIRLQAGTSGSVNLRFTIPGTATVDVAGVAVDCFTTTGTSGDLSVPIVAPTDGSQRAFVATATASCTDESRTFTHDFAMSGVAPASVAPGQPVSITFDWRGLASQLADQGTVSVSGTAGGPSELRFAGINGTAGIHLTTGPAAASGAVRLEFTRVESALQALNPPHVNPATCTFPAGGAVVTVPISTTPPPTATTTTTRPPGGSFLAIVQRLLCLVFRVC